jgi:Late exocytosis, associated with Golgi transport/Calcium-dependent channel, 7TM region, putative phosphate/Cytosolic domain of 10TM putative phosphate transporter
MTKVHQPNEAFDPFHVFGNHGGTSSSNNVTNFDKNLVKANDVSVDAVVTSLYFNSIIFVVLMLSYEGIRRLFPSVYSRKKRIQFKNGGGYHRCTSGSSSFLDDDDKQEDEATTLRARPETTHATSARDSISQGGDGNFVENQVLTSLPDESLLDWIVPVMSVPWSQVRDITLDGYFFLRYIRMNIRITCVSSFWFFLILVPLYATGNNPNHSRGWYHLSAANLSTEGWRMWVAVLFWYLFSAFIVFVIEQEYRHFLDLRQSFLAKGCENVNPQHHYSIKVESIPRELRSDRALTEYFEKLFPGRVHSSSVLLAAGDLEDVSIRCKEACHRLEKSIAYFHANGTRPSHIVGHSCQEAMSLVLSSMGCSDKKSCSFSCGIWCHYRADEEVAAMADADMRTETPPPKGTRVDSISYYTWDLAQKSRQLFQTQRQKAIIGKLGNESIRADNWLDQLGRNVEFVTADVMGDSINDNNLSPPAKSFLNEQSPPPRRGFFSPVSLKKNHGEAASLIKADYGSFAATQAPETAQDVEHEKTPFAKTTCCLVSRRWAARLGLDFALSALRLMNVAVDATFDADGVIGTTMSSTGFVTFLDLSSTTVAASAPLTVKSHSLKASIAPEPREILWKNAHVAQSTQLTREVHVNIVLFFGVILWSFPLTAIQVFAKAEYIAQIPGMEWILSFNGGTLTSFVNGYLPVVALLFLICVLPIIFQQLALYYERRKTISDVQASICRRYFYYQLANIYITVSAGSLFNSLAEILDHPSNILELLGKSLPYMVGYFVALVSPIRFCFCREFCDGSLSHW